MPLLTREEMECIFYLSADNRQTIHVFCDDLVWQRKLERLGAKITRDLGNGGKEYEIEYRQLSIRKAGKKEMSAEQKEKARERMREIGMRSQGRKKNE